MLQQSIDTRHAYNNLTLKHQNIHLHQCLIVFSLDNSQLKKHYTDSDWTNGYADIRQIFHKYRFKNIQGTVYLGDCGVNQAQGVIVLQDLATSFKWFDKCTSNFHFYNLTGNLNARFIVDNISQNRQTPYLT